VAGIGLFTFPFPRSWEVFLQTVQLPVTDPCINPKTATITVLVLLCHVECLPAQLLASSVQFSSVQSWWCEWDLTQQNQTRSIKTRQKTKQTPVHRRLFQDNVCKPAPERLNQSGFWWSNRWRGGSGISWIICKSFAPCSRPITTPAPHHSIFYRLDALPDTQPTVSKQGRHKTR